MQFLGFDWHCGYGTEGEPLYHAQEIATIKLSSGGSCEAKSAISSNSFDCFNKTINLLALVGYQMIEANSAQRA